MTKKPKDYLSREQVLDAVARGFNTTRKLRQLYPGSSEQRASLALHRAWKAGALSREVATVAQGLSGYYVYSLALPDTSEAPPAEAEHKLELPVLLLRRKTGGYTSFSSQEAALKWAFEKGKLAVGEEYVLYTATGIASVAPSFKSLP